MEKRICRKRAEAAGVLRRAGHGESSLRDSESGRRENVGESSAQAGKKEAVENK